MYLLRDERFSLHYKFQIDEKPVIVRSMSISSTYYKSFPQTEGKESLGSGILTIK